MDYEPNPKHKRVAQPGPRGSLCPSAIRIEDAQALLQNSLEFGRQRYSSDGQHAYCAKCHDRTRDAWHGYPMTWNEVDPRIRTLLVEAGLVDRRSIRRALRANR